MSPLTTISKSALPGKPYRNASRRKARIPIVLLILWIGIFSVLPVFASRAYTVSLNGALDRLAYGPQPYNHVYASSIPVVFPDKGSTGPLVSSPGTPYLIPVSTFTCGACPSNSFQLIIQLQNLEENNAVIKDANNMVIATIYDLSTPNATKTDDGNPSPDGTYTLPILSGIPAWYLISTSIYSGTVRLSTFGTDWPLCLSGETCNFVFGVNFPPHVSFAWTEDMTSNLRVNFTSHISDGTPPYSYVWTFGDGHTADHSNSFNNYASPGNYTVTLRVTDAMGKAKSNTSIVSVAPISREPFPVHGLPSWIATATVVGLGVYIPIVLAISYFFISRERKKIPKRLSQCGHGFKDVNSA